MMDALAVVSAVALLCFSFIVGRASASAEPLSLSGASGPETPAACSAFSQPQHQTTAQPDSPPERRHTWQQVARTNYTDGSYLLVVGCTKCDAIYRSSSDPRVDRLGLYVCDRKVGIVSTGSCPAVSE